MVFSSLIFLYAFLPLSLLVYVLCRGREAKNMSLLVFSLIFYAWGEPKYVLLLMFMSLCSWFCALRVEKADSQGRRKFWVAVSCAIDIALIGFFKYAGLVCSVFGQVPEFVANIALPIGISFYTFQLLTYVVDVYRGDAEAQPSYLNVLLYASLFHQCVAGPIVRYKTIAHELFVERDSQDILPGISRFTVGLAKKTLLANPCGALADQLLLTTDAASNASLFSENLASLSGLSALGAWVGVAAFMMQIYLDFSAYSDMAIGMGRMLGLHYLENFDYPYLSKTVTEFWRRWHISLGTFFRDYVYIPLGGRQCSKAVGCFRLFMKIFFPVGMCMVMPVMGMLFARQQIFLMKTIQRIDNHKRRIRRQHIRQKLLHPAAVGHKQVCPFQAHQIFWTKLIIMETPGLWFRHVGDLHAVHAVREIHEHDIKRIK